jgi:hypothetical protein
MQDFEKLGVFYLGKVHDPSGKSKKTDLILYDSKDMVTHAVCVGMTGSGKTGLCLALLEEAAIDSIPAIAIDPKGDLTNLLLTFPELRGEDFQPWVNEDDARKKGLSVADYAQKQAELWKNGMAEWGEDGARITRLRQSADFAIYTPGSTAGIPISVLKSFAAPAQAVRDDAELLRDRVGATATSLLGLTGVDADPVQSREHILLSTILTGAWKDGKDVSLGELIQLIQNPPIERVGVIDLESFFPAKDRFALAMQINNLLASPGFEAWTQGEPLDVAALLHTPDGKPRISIISIAHLNDAERMFVVSMLLNEVLSWVRAQPGTTSLRALLYMDEIFGYFPPTANPPSKQPLLTLLKQARAFGLGVVLATQNPVDLDYKGLANAGTWFIGRLQTERDKARVMDGLAGAAAGTGQRFDRSRVEQTLAGLGSRIFLMNNVHEDHPVLFEVRWLLCYLRGPLTRAQIKTLMSGRTGTKPQAEAPPAPAPATPTKAGTAALSPPARAPAAADQRPLLPPEVPQVFLPVRSAGPENAQLVYQPVLLGYSKVYFGDAKSGVDFEQDVACLTPFKPGATSLDWKDAEPVEVPEADLEKDPDATGRFSSVPAAAGKVKNFDTWKKALADTLYRTRRLQLFQSPGLGEISKPGEAERDFRVRLQHAAREERDSQADKLRERYAPKVSALQERIRKAEQAVQRQTQQSRQTTLHSVISFGSTILGAFTSRKTISATNISKAATAMRGASRTMKASGDVTRAEDNVAALQQQLAELEAKFQEELRELESKVDPQTEKFETVDIRPKKSDIKVGLVALAWAPYWNQGSEQSPAWE